MAQHTQLLEPAIRPMLRGMVSLLRWRTRQSKRKICLKELENKGAVILVLTVSPKKMTGIKVESQGLYSSLQRSNHGLLLGNALS